LHEEVNTKYIIFIGELGASDGSEGMYKYLTLHPRLKTVVREILSNGNGLIGGPIIKEVFVFEIK